MAVNASPAFTAGGAPINPATTLTKLRKHASPPSSSAGAARSSGETWLSTAGNEFIGVQTTPSPSRRHTEQLLATSATASPDAQQQKPTQQQQPQQQEQHVYALTHRRGSVSAPHLNPVRGRVRAARRRKLTRQSHWASMDPEKRAAKEAARRRALAGLPPKKRPSEHSGQHRGPSSTPSLRATSPVSTAHPASVSGTAWFGPHTKTPALPGGMDAYPRQSAIWDTSTSIISPASTFLRDRRATPLESQREWSSKRHRGQPPPVDVEALASTFPRMMHAIASQASMASTHTVTLPGPGMPSPTARSTAASVELGEHRSASTLRDPQVTTPASSDLPSPQSPDRPTSPLVRVPPSQPGDEAEVEAGTSDALVIMEDNEQQHAANSGHDLSGFAPDPPQLTAMSSSDSLLQPNGGAAPAHRLATFQAPVSMVQSERDHKIEAMRQEYMGGPYKLDRGDDVVRRSTHKAFSAGGGVGNMLTGVPLVAPISHAAHYLRFHTATQRRILSPAKPVRLKHTPLPSSTDEAGSGSSPPRSPPSALAEASSNSYLPLPPNALVTSWEGDRLMLHRASAVVAQSPCTDSATGADKAWLEYIRQTQPDKVSLRARRLRAAETKGAFGSVDYTQSQQPSQQQSQQSQQSQQQQQQRDAKAAAPGARYGIFVAAQQSSSPQRGLQTGWNASASFRQRSMSRAVIPNLAHRGPGAVSPTTARAQMKLVRLDSSLGDENLFRIHSVQGRGATTRRWRHKQPQQQKRQQQPQQQQQQPPQQRHHHQQRPQQQQEQAPELQSPPRSSFGSSAPRSARRPRWQPTRGNSVMTTGTSASFQDSAAAALRSLGSSASLPYRSGASNFQYEGDGYSDGDSGGLSHRQPPSARAAASAHSMMSRLELQFSTPFATARSMRTTHTGRSSIPAAASARHG